MNTLKIAFVGLLAAHAVTDTFAQSGVRSSVSLYGRVDASLNLHRFSANAGQPGFSATYLSSDTSRWGVRGSEDLGGGMSAYSKLEHGFNVDTGSASSPIAFFNRESIVGLSHRSLGSIQLGSQFTPSIWLTSKIDPFQRGNGGAILTLFQQGGAAGARGYPSQQNNAAQYISPLIGGLLVRAMIAAKEGQPPLGNPRALSVDFTRDRLFVGVVAERATSIGSAVGQPARATATNTAALLGATYRFDGFKLHGMLIKNRIDGTTGMRGGMVGVSVPAGAGEIQATYQRRDVDDAANSDASLVAVQYMHALSKRTSVYVGTARQRNDGAAAFGIWPSRLDQGTAGVPRAGGDVTALQTGIRHLF